MDFHSMSIEEVLKHFGSSKNGLSEKEVLKKRKEFGENEIRAEKKKNLVGVFLKQLNSLLIYILILAGIISWITGHFVDAVVIGVIVILNATIGFVQEYKADEIIEKLKSSLNYKATVMRNGERKEIDSKELVPGDIVFFDQGAKILVDARIISCGNFQTNESALTGESFPVDKKFGVIENDRVLAERENMIYAGTNVARGKVTAIVVGTGANTEFGKLAELVRETPEEKMPLEKKVDEFSRNVAIFVLCFVGIIFFLGIYLGIDKMSMFMMSISLAIGAIPEGLPAIIAITLAVAIKQMYKVNTLIRRLPAAETLGRATVICTDKTGTLTEENLTVEKVYVGEIKNVDEIKMNERFSQLLKIGILCNNARDESHEIFGDPLEVSLINLAKKFGVEKKNLAEENERIEEFEFDSGRKMMSIVRENGNIKTSYVKGASSLLVQRCTKELIGSKIVLIDRRRKEELNKIANTMESEGLRVIGFAFKQVTNVNQKNVENNLIFVGFCGMIDPPRKEVRGAIRDAMDAGIKIKIITGDAVLTTKAIAEQIGLVGEAIEGSELDKLDDEKWDEVVRTKTIFARVTPEQKLRVVEILKKQNETVAVTGDGVNDILALKKADIGISMGIRGSDVTRDSSDMVLLDDNFASIIKAIRQGRRVFDNMKKSIKFLLAANAGEVIAIFISIVFGLPLPFLPLAILWMNLVTDSLPALALAVERAEEDVMKRKPREEGILEGTWRLVVVAGILFSVGVIGIMIWAKPLYGLEIARTMAVTSAISFELFFVFSCKSKKSVLGKTLLENKWMIYAFLISFGFQFFAIYTPLGNVFEFVPLKFGQLLISIGVGFFGVLIIEFRKIIFLFFEKSKRK